MLRKQSRARIIARKSVFAVGVAALFALLGLFDGLGYHATAEVISYSSYSESSGNLPFGLAGPSLTSQVDMDIFYDATFNPILYPFYWLIGEGRIQESSTVTFTSDSDLVRPGHIGENPHMRTAPSSARSASPTGSSGGTVTQFLTNQDRVEYFVLGMAMRGTFGNLVFLLMMTAVVEILGKRVLYLVLFAGIIGFLLGGIVGVVFGLVASSLATLIYRFKLSRNPKLVEYWSSLEKAHMPRQ